jgi:hypothetical protein
MNILELSANATQMCALERVGVIQAVVQDRVEAEMTE